MFVRPNSLSKPYRMVTTPSLFFSFFSFLHSSTSRQLSFSGFVTDHPIHKSPRALPHFSVGLNSLFFFFPLLFSSFPPSLPIPNSEAMAAAGNPPPTPPFHGHILIFPLLFVCLWRIFFRLLFFSPPFFFPYFLCLESMRWRLAPDTFFFERRRREDGNLEVFLANVSTPRYFFLPFPSSFSLFGDRKRAATRFFDAAAES